MLVLTGAIVEDALLMLDVIETTIDIVNLDVDTIFMLLTVLIPPRVRGKTDAETTGVTNGFGGAGRGNQSFRRDASEIQTVSPHQVTLNERHFRPESGSTSRADESRRPRTDDDEVVTRCRFRIDPSGRVHMFDERTVPFIIRAESNRIDHEAIIAAVFRNVEIESAESE